MRGRREKAGGEGGEGERDERERGRFIHRQLPHYNETMSTNHFSHLLSLFLNLGSCLGVLSLGPALGRSEDLLLLPLLLPFVIQPINGLQYLQLATDF